MFAIAVSKTRFDRDNNNGGVAQDAAELDLVTTKTRSHWRLESIELAEIFGRFAAIHQRFAKGVRLNPTSFYFVAC
ncbi:MULTISPECIES: hypothetical protein [unclassified Chamaesiphon]|uniref:hypothetical protein n=1 Tax=unclassified Chamaesiphon TaxID=2620921 RepID=UPI00286A5B76|nr:MULTISPECIES: hypothetical protein [unclassified Chamaesiphon]